MIRYGNWLHAKVKIACYNDTIRLQMTLRYNCQRQRQPNESFMQVSAFKARLKTKNETNQHHNLIFTDLVDDIPPSGASSKKRVSK